MVELRSLVKEDTELLFVWRNLPYIVERSTSQLNVERDEHYRWVEETLESTSRLVYIVELDSKPIGMVRFDDLKENCFVIAIYILEEFTGKGIGTTAITSSIEKLADHKNTRKVFAFVRNDNINGYKAFGKVGFIEELHKDCPENHYSLAFTLKN